MKKLLLVLIPGLILFACRSEKRWTQRNAGFFSSQPVNLTVSETIRDTLVIDENINPEPPKSEKITLTQGAELTRYCVIVGSFINVENAVRLRNMLMRQGFFGSSIMRNSVGMYRVSAECGDNHDDAWQEVCRIRSQYPQFHDAWLLGVEK